MKQLNFFTSLDELIDQTDIKKEPIKTVTKAVKTYHPLMNCKDCGTSTKELKAKDIGINLADGKITCTPCLHLSDDQVRKAVLFIASRRPCQVCNKKGQKLGVNSSISLTICEECDRRNNPYYYGAE